VGPETPHQPDSGKWNSLEPGKAISPEMLKWLAEVKLNDVTQADVFRQFLPDGH
jgi:hypothetical protein